MDRKLATLIGASARLHRLRLGQTQAELSERLGITPECYGRIERGHMLPSLETFVRLIRVLGVPADQLLAKPGESPPLPESLPPQRENPEIRRLLSRIRSLNAGQVRLLTQLVTNLLAQRKKPGSHRGKTG